MKKNFLLLLLSIFFIQFTTTAQVVEPVKWKLIPTSKGDGKFELKFYATIDNGWYLYSQTVEPGGPLPTTFYFDEVEGVKLVGDIAENGKVKEGFDAIFEMNVKKFEQKADFTAVVELEDPKAEFELEVSYMSCNDEACVKLQEFFDISLARTVTKDIPAEDLQKELDKDANLSGSSVNEQDKDPLKIVEEKSRTGSDKIEDNSTNVANTDTDKNKDEKSRTSRTINTKEEETAVNETSTDNNDNAEVTSGSADTDSENNELANQETAPTTGTDSEISTTTGGKEQQQISDEPLGLLKAKISDCGIPVEEEAKGLWLIFFFGFLGGLAALLTPCVFPMIPLTVSFFTKQSKSQKAGFKNAAIYALSIVVIYVALGFLVSAAFGPDTLNALSTNPWFNLAFFAIFVIFAISFFGFFEITLPSSLVNNAEKASDRGGLLGIFFMAFTLSLVSFSCTGPIIGTLLVQAAVDGAQLGPIVGMTGFAVALALPFALFAAFPAWLNSLPSSGGWLNSVKVMLGFVELIFALKFLSNADLTRQWWLLPRELFLGIWIVLFVLMAMYMVGLIKFPHDSPVRKLNLPKGLIASACLAGAIYLVPGIFCNNLSLVSGFPPPVFYSWNCGGEGHIEAHIKDMDEAIEVAKKQKKPILVDFTGWACVNCRKMEENVWPLPEVSELIEEYTLVSLYVDEDIQMPKEEHFTYYLNGKKRKARTVGNKWSYLQTSCFATNTQPYYVLLNEKGELLEKPKGYTPNVKEYTDFLENGMKNFKEDTPITRKIKGQP